MISDEDKIARLTGEARDRRWANVRPMDAATLIIVDQRQKAPRVLMGKRHPNHKFMPDKFVFPGGRIEPQDRGVPVESELRPDVVGALVARTRAATRNGPGNWPLRPSARPSRKPDWSSGCLENRGARRQLGHGRNSPRPVICPISRPFTSLPARSRRQNGRSVSTPVLRGRCHRDPP